MSTQPSIQTVRADPDGSGNAGTHVRSCRSETGCMSAQIRSSDGSSAWRSPIQEANKEHLVAYNCLIV